MHTRLAILLCLLFCQVKGQVNLVPNYSFEEVNGCPFTFSLYDTTVVNWYQPTLGSSDIYTPCGVAGGRSVPANLLGFQYAQHEQNYSGIVLFAPSIYNYREYIGVKLIETLKPNTYYCFKMHVSLSDDYNLGISSIGANFREDSIYQEHTKILPFTPQIENSENNFINDTTSWVVIKGSFKATGNEKYMYIGNFRPDSTTVTQNFTPGARSYVYIDNVQVYECDSTLSINENLKGKVTIYPNPAQDFVSIDIPTNYQNPQLSIYNLTGQLISQQQITSNQQIPISALGNGMYIFVIQSGDKVIGRQRVVVAK
jgi:OmpA-OmpF porin, OOP family